MSSGSILPSDPAANPEGTGSIPRDHGDAGAGPWRQKRLCRTTAGLTLPRLLENNSRNARVALLLQEDEPPVADKLRRCCEFIQQRPDNTWQPAYRCRQHLVCANCQIVRSQLLADQYREAVDAHEDTFGYGTRLLSYVLHPQPPAGTPAVAALWRAAAQIEAFGDRLYHWRFKQNLRELSKAGRPPAVTQLIGPTMLCSHVKPAAKFRVKAFLAHRKESIHSHLLVAVHPRAKVRDLQQNLERLWRLAGDRLPTGTAMDVLVKTERREFDDSQHADNTLAYLARPVKPHWNHLQTRDAYSIIGRLPRTVLSRVIGTATTLGELPHRTPIRGDAMQFLPDELRFKPVHLDNWT